MSGMCSAPEEGVIVKGVGGGLLLPDSGATRAQAAVMICRMLDIAV